MRALRSAVVATLVVPAAVVAAPASADPAPDTEGPVLSVPAVAAIVVGQQVSDTIDYEGNPTWFGDGGSWREYVWQASDPSGICGYSIDEEHGVEGWYDDVIVESTTATEGSYQFFADEFFNSDDLSQVRINVRDCADNITSAVRPGAYSKVVVDYGATASPGWTSVGDVEAIGDTVLRTARYGATLSTVINPMDSLVPGEVHIALIMATGPRNGRAAIYVDGTQVATVDTWSATRTDRIVVWGQAFSGSDDHTITVVNVHAPGRPFIEVDAVIR